MSTCSSSARSASLMSTCQRRSDPDQARIVALNSHQFQKNGGYAVISIKANCIDSTAEPEAVVAGEVNKLKEEKFKPQEQVMAFTFVAFCYLMALIVAAFCVFFAIYTVICIDELKTEYKNPIEQCRSLNSLVLPEYILHGIMTLLFIFAMQIIAIVYNVPLVIFHAYTYVLSAVMSGPGIYDPTTILNRTELSRCMRISWVKLAFYLISFFYYLYGLIYTFVTN